MGVGGENKTFSHFYTFVFFLEWLSMTLHSLLAHCYYTAALFLCGCLLIACASCWYWFSLFVRVCWGLPNFGSGLIIQRISIIFNPRGSLPPTLQLMADPMTLCSALCCQFLLCFHFQQLLFIQSLLSPSSSPVLSAFPSLIGSH